MDKKDLEKIILKGQKEQREEYQRYLGVVAEEQNSRIKFLAESISGVEESLSRKIDGVEEGLSRKIDRNAEMIARNAVNIEIVKSDIQFIKQELGHKVDKDEFNSLEKRAMFLEKKLNKV